MAGVGTYRRRGEHETEEEEEAHERERGAGLPSPKKMLKRFAGNGKRARK
jgi:hypothetical protein